MSYLKYRKGYETTCHELGTLQNLPFAGPLWCSTVIGHRLAASSPDLNDVRHCYIIAPKSNNKTKSWMRYFTQTALERSNKLTDCIVTNASNRHHPIYSIADSAPQVPMLHSSRSADGASGPSLLIAFSWVRCTYVLTVANLAQSNKRGLQF